MLLWLQITLILVPFCVAVYVGHVSRQVFDASRRMKRINDLDLTMSDLQSSFQALLESHNRLRSRTGMRELREREAQPGQESKAAIRKRLFGVAAGPAFAARQAELNARNKD